MQTSNVFPHTNGGNHSNGNGKMRRQPKLQNSITFLSVLYRDVATPNGALHDGKSDAGLSIGLGGFSMHAAPAAVQGRTVKEVHMVAPVPWLELPTLTSALMGSILLSPVVLVDHHHRQRLPVSVVRSDPALDVRQIEKERHSLAIHLKPERVPEGALRSVIVASGRVPPEVASAWNAECEHRGSIYCWCGGESLDPKLAPFCHGIVVDQNEAERMVRIRNPTPMRLALALLRRARLPGAFRVVTGGGSKPAALAVESQQYHLCLEADPVTLAPGQVQYLTGPGDVFAGRFLAETFFDAQGSLRPEPDWKRGLQHARFAAGAWVASRQHFSPAEIEAAITNRPEYNDGANAIRVLTMPKRTSRTWAASRLQRPVN